jgi:hypothetical protein
MCQPSMMKSRSLSVFGLVAISLWVAAIACTPGPPRELAGPDAERSPAPAESGVLVEVGVSLVELNCLDQNDSNEFDDEVFVVASWTGAERGSRQLPADAGRWRMCGQSEFEPSVLVDVSMRAGQSLTVRVEVVEDDSQAERVSNQIDDTLARFDLEVRTTEVGSLDVEATPRSVQDNNATGLLPLVDLEVDNELRRLVFTTRYGNADGAVHYTGTLTW